jgi:hypothetical protein
MKYEVENNKLITSEFIRYFKCDAAMVIFHDNLFIVMLDAPNNSYEEDNIWGYDRKGNMLWRIQPAEIMFPKPNFAKLETYKAWSDKDIGRLWASVYVGIRINENNILTATDFNAMRYEVDHKTGKLLSKECVGW